MDDLIPALELLRERHGFRGYIHVKIVPGAEAAQIERLTSLASRVSLNLEAPCGESLAQIAPDKSFDARARRPRAGARAGDSASALRGSDGPAARPAPSRRHGGDDDAVRRRRHARHRPHSSTKVTELYAGGGIHHAHFSAFRPIRDTPMENVPRRAGAARAPALPGRLSAPATTDSPPTRSSTTTAATCRSRSIRRSPGRCAIPERFPVEVRTAPYEELRARARASARRPARRIVAERGDERFPRPRRPPQIGVVTTRAAGFLTLGGRRLQDVRGRAARFWQPEDEAGAYQLVYDVSPGTFR